MRKGAKLNSVKLDADIKRIERKEFKKSEFTFLWMDTYVANKATDEKKNDYIAFCYDPKNMKDIQVSGSENPRKGRDHEKVREYFLKEIITNFEEPGSKPKKTAEQKFTEYLNDLKF